MQKVYPQYKGSENIINLIKMTLKFHAKWNWFNEMMFKYLLNYIASLCNNKDALHMMDIHSYYCQVYPHLE